MMMKFLKDWTLPIAMLIGAVGYPIFMALSFLTPVLIFSMLLLTFCKVSFNDLRLTRLHLWLMLIQFAGALLVYLLLAQFDPVIAQGVMVCIICPTATAAAVITTKLGGNASNLITYTLVANVGAALVVPTFFPLIEPNPDLTFWSAFTRILSRVFPLLICPILVAELLRRYFSKAHRVLLNYHHTAFYLWALSLVIVTAQTVSTLLNSPGDGRIEGWIALGAFVACGLQFFLGKTVGQVYHDRIGGGQALGQKNTILALWMAHTYLNPVASIGPGSYVLWQNIINSWQLWKKRKNETKKRVS